IDHLDYAGFGKVTTETSPSNGDRYAYTSRERDTEINLQFNRARYYNWDTGRWMSEDLIGFEAGDSNLYRYVENRPTIRTDPSGTFSVVGPPRISPYAELSDPDMLRYQRRLMLEGALKRIAKELRAVEKEATDLKKTQVFLLNAIQTMKPPAKKELQLR